MKASLLCAEPQNSTETSFLTRQLVVLSFDYRHSVRIISRSVGVHVLDMDVDTAYAEKVAGRVKNATPYQEIFNVNYGDAIIKPEAFQSYIIKNTSTA